jgi:hypothetical protein
MGAKRLSAAKIYQCLFVAAAHRDCNGVLPMASVGDPIGHSQ